MLFCHPSTDDVEAVKEILHRFGRVSGLQVNYAKSSASLLHCDNDDATTVAQHLACPIVNLPIMYLGIQLTTRRLTAAQLQPI